MSQVLITVANVSKSYPTFDQGKHKLEHVWARLRGAAPKHVFQALTDISFEVRRGQSLGLVGVNGAGKSTLLKLIAGVATPSAGTVQRAGRIGALLELGAGFHPEYTGRENVFLSCSLMGLARAETSGLMDSILSFAEIGEHIDQPIKHYSSGMVVRLGFAVATSVVPEVLITDEVLAVGDESFQKKCVSWLEEYRANGGTLLLCSHSMFHIQKLCQHAIWLDGGKVQMHGTSADVTRSYLAWHEEKTRAQKKPELGEAGQVATERSADIYQINDMLLNGKPAGEALIINMGGSITVSGSVYSPDGRTPNVAVGFVRADGTPIYGVISEMDDYVLTQKGQHLFEYSIVFDDLPLLPGRYVARSHALDPEGLRLFDQVEMPFDISGDSRELGYCRLKHHWITHPKT
jgi:lipopolysaccharide transport system ATP-binding protein